MRPPGGFIASPRLPSAMAPEAPTRSHPVLGPAPEAVGPTIAPVDLAAALKGTAPPVLVDLRAAGERRDVRFPDDRSVPLPDLLEGAGSLPRDRRLVLYDHFGEIAPRAVAALRARHPTLDAVALEGGVDAYARLVDPALGRYPERPDGSLVLQLPRPQTGCLAYLLADVDERKAVLVDPGIDADPYVARLRASGWTLDAIVETHTHADHLAGHAALHRRTGAPICVSRRSPAAYAHRSLSDGEAIAVGRHELVALETPGHTKDHLTMRFGGSLFTGDTLLIGACGRTDLGGGDPLMLFHSLRDVLLRLPDETQVYPAHYGPKHGIVDRYVSTIGIERATNEAVRIATEPEFVTYMTEGWPPKPADFDRIVAANLADAPAPD